jgi:TolB-like protein
VALVLVLVTTKLAQQGRADGITSLAIAPQQTDSGIQYLSDGIQEGVADILRRFPQLRVTAPSLVGQVRGQEPGLNDVQLGERLKVGSVLTWHLRQENDSIHVRAELLRIPEGDLRWSFSHARPVAEVAAIQGEIARMISDSLRLQVTGVERATMVRQTTTSAAAYDFYLRGRKFTDRATPLGATAGRAMLDSTLHYAQQAIARDSNYAAAYALRSTYYFLSAFRGWRQPFEAYLDSAAVAARRAMALDSTLGDPWVNRLAQALYLDDDFPEARRLAPLAFRLAAHDPGVLQFVSIIVGEVEGDIDSALVIIRRSVELEPGTGNLNTLGDLLLRARLNDSAIAVLRSAIASDPGVPGPRRRLILALERAGRYGDAVAERRSRGDPDAEEFAQAYATSGARGYQQVLAQDARERIDSLTRAMSEPFTLPRDTIPPTRESQIAALYAQLGEWSSAMDWIVRERQRRPKRFRLYVANPDFAGVRSDPRFAALVREDGLEALVRRTR